MSDVFFGFYKKEMFFCVENSLKNALKNTKKHEIFQKREKMGRSSCCKLVKISMKSVKNSLFAEKTQ
jgi:hypothetical protein